MFNGSLVTKPLILILISKKVAWFISPATYHQGVLPAVFTWYRQNIKPHLCPRAPALRSSKDSILVPTCINGTTGGHRLPTTDRQEVLS